MFDYQNVIEWIRMVFLSTKRLKQRQTTTAHPIFPIEKWWWCQVFVRTLGETMLYVKGPGVVKAPPFLSVSGTTLKKSELRLRRRKLSHRFCLASPDINIWWCLITLFPLLPQFWDHVFDPTNGMFGASSLSVSASRAGLWKSRTVTGEQPPGEMD